MCDIAEAFKTMIEDTPGMTYEKLGLMIGENHKKLQALFDPDREDRPFQLKHAVPTMTACNDLTPLKLLNAHFGLSTFNFGSKSIELNSQGVLDFLTEATGAGNVISKAIDPKSPGGKHLTKEERQMCLRSVLKTISVLMGIANRLQEDE